ncbi:MAG: hypothetical protein MI867_09130 [Pseudomonadales bacterium]|nr:hypothetical protein [Pseudomonadales bacterium]
MTSQAIITKDHFLGFKVEGEIVNRLQTFIDAVESQNKKAGNHYVSFVESLTDHITTSLLVDVIEIAEISKVGQKVVGVCVSSSNKVSGMLSSKIYAKKSVKELGPVADLWKSRLKNSADDHSGDWYLIAPIDKSFGDALGAIKAEKGDEEHFAPKSLDQVMQQYDKLSKVIIDSFFLEATRLVEMGSITKTMLSTGVSTVEKAVASVFDKVIRPLEPMYFGRFVDHASQFHVRF